jgi:uncharacterized protein
MALFDAIAAGDVEQVRTLLQDDPSLAGARCPDSGVSAVLSARYRQRMDLVEAVLEAGPELDVFDAAALGRVDRLRQLLDDDPGAAGAWSTDGFTPLHLAAFFAQPAAVALLLGRGADVGAVARNPMQVQALHSAVAGRDAESVRLLLAAGADPDARQHGGWTPLMAARQHGDAVVERLLLDYGASDGADAGPAPESGNVASTS